MKKRTARFAIAFFLVLSTGCATVDDVRRASDLIRTDNELTRLLVEVRPNDQAGAAMYLSGLAAHAKDEADALRTIQGKKPDAIAYYRIAATAYWRSGNPEVVNELFEVSDAGSELCSQLGDNAPDRDCLFLRLVIPFAGLEANANGNGLSGVLASVNFTDNAETPKEIETMGKISDALNQTKPVVQKILAIGKDERLVSHPGMHDYYCTNAKKAFGYYDSTAAVFVTKVKEFHDNFPGNNPPLGITVDSAREIRKIGLGVPAYCQ
ncbi:MAG: hypothetical protein ABIL58_12885 [Pseudomonadota bacterium]